MQQITGKTVVVMGLGRFGGGVGVSRFLAARGAKVLVTDLLPADKLADSVKALADCPVEFRLGEHREEDFAHADLVVVNPAVDPRNNKFIQAAIQAGVELTSEIRLLIQHLPNRRQVIGITGTAGKSTTTAMIGHILAKALGPDRVHVGGNLGGSLLGQIDSIRPQDPVVLELSSFMLEGIERDQWSPHVAVVTNIADNHLDRHETMANYAAAKQTILRHQQPGDVAILGQPVADWQVKGGVTRQVVANKDYGYALLVPGAHNQTNAAMALAACSAALNREPADLAPLLADFPGLPHRLQFVGQRGGVRFFNDSKSTTPQAALLGIGSFPPGTVHAILGGYDKHADLTDMARHAATCCAGLYTIGATGEAVSRAAEQANGCPVFRCDDLAHAVGQAIARARSGQVILLSPGCASWDQFENYEKRGEMFAQLANAPAPAAAQ